MKHGIELNGIANAQILLDELNHIAPSLTNDQYDCVAKTYEQLELLERYMIAYSKAVREGTEPPYWHEVRENPKAYPLNREITD